MVPFITGRCSGDRGKAETREEKCESPPTAKYRVGNKMDIKHHHVRLKQYSDYMRES